MKEAWGAILLACALAGCDASSGGPVNLESAVVATSDASATSHRPQNRGWEQWGQNAQHTGAVSTRGQVPSRVLASLTYDPFVAKEQAEFSGELLGHFQAPLLDGDDVYMEFKTGQYISCDPPGAYGTPGCGSFAWDQQIWNERRLRWRGSRLVEVWNFETDWKPEPDGFYLGGWEPVFHPALSRDFVWVPGAGGTVFQVDKQSGRAIRRVNPFDTIDAATMFVSGPITVDDRGNVYYNVIKLATDDGGSPTWFADIAGAWLVKVERDGRRVTKASYSTLVPGAPAATDACHAFYFGFPLPWPPPEPVPTSPCGSQRPGVNVAPAIAADGTIYTATLAHFLPTYSYVVAVNPDLTPKWAASMRDRLHDGCGSPDLPFGTDIGNCRPGAPPGVDPLTGDLPAGWVWDQSSSTPVVAPDGSVLYGSFGYDHVFRGHLFKFSAEGEFQGAYDFGWDSTPAIFDRGTRHGKHHYAIVLKDNHYPGPNVCFDPSCPQRGEGPFYITELDEDLNVRWNFQNTNTESCQRNPDGTLTCVSDHPAGFEWCINAPAVDRDGNVYVNSEDGNLYVLDDNGHEKARLFLNLALEAAYTPLALSDDGTIFTENDGQLFVVGEHR